MGKKGGWFSVVKKVLSPESKKDQKTPKSKKKWFGKGKDLGPVSLPEKTSVTAPSLPTEDVKLTEAEDEQSKHAYSVAIATAMAAKAAVAAAQAAAEVVRLTSAPRNTGKSKEEIAAIRIQTAFRGYLARRALQALRGLVRLKSLIQGQSVKRQADTTLRCMQTLAHLQSQIRSRRIRMPEENKALQRQLQQKRENELAKLRASGSAWMGEDWNDSTYSKEQIKARQQNKQEAAMRRERALAYAFSHQQTWKNSSKSVNPTFMDPNSLHWGWSWLERWVAARPLEIQSATDNNDHGSVKSMGARSMSTSEISRAYSRRDLNNDNKLPPTPSKSSRPPSRKFPSTPPSSKTRPPSRRGSQWGADEDSRSMFSLQSDRYRRHSIPGSSVRDDDSLTSSPAVPSYMLPTQSTKARSRLQSPLGLEVNETPKRGLAGSAKKRLSFPSPGTNRRHSGPPKADITLVKDIKMHKEEKLSNGEGR